MFRLQSGFLFVSNQHQNSKEYINIVASYFLMKYLVWFCEWAWCLFKDFKVLFVANKTLRKLNVFPQLIKHCFKMIFFAICVGCVSHLNTGNICTRSAAGCFFHLKMFAFEHTHSTEHLAFKYTPKGTKESFKLCLGKPLLKGKKIKALMNH